jgi:hypothetical protein
MFSAKLRAAVVALAFGSLLMIGGPTFATQAHPQHTSQQVGSASSHASWLAHLFHFFHLDSGWGMDPNGGH